MLTGHHHGVMGDVEDSKVSKRTILETCHKVLHAKTRQEELTCNMPMRTYMLRTFDTKRKLEKS
jgi:hypothetical protein